MIRRLAQSMVGCPLRSYVPVLPCVHWFRMSQGPSGYRIGWMDWLHRDHGLSHPSQQKMLNKAASQCGSYFIIFPHSFPFRKRMFAGYSFNYPSSPKKLRHSYGDQPAPTTFHYPLAIQPGQLQMPQNLHVSMDWFKGKSTGNHCFYHQI